jgi:organic hydroperoxide reductase OsmC/OhrA
MAADGGRSGGDHDVRQEGVIAMSRQHHYRVAVTWRGNMGAGTASPRAYSRAHEIGAPGKPAIAGSSDPSFRGDPARWNPEDLGLCADAGIVVAAYEDHAEGVMAEQADGAGQFTKVILRPRVTLAAGGDMDAAMALHRAAHAMCFIARSVNFPVEHRPEMIVA